MGIASKKDKIKTNVEKNAVYNCWVCPSSILHNCSEKKTSIMIIMLFVNCREF